MKTFWIVFTLFAISMTVTGTGVALLVARHQMDVPESYRESTIHYRESLPKSKVKLHVAKNDLTEMARRVRYFTENNSGEVTYDTTDEGIWEVHKLEVPVEAAQHLSLLHNHGGRGLSPGYKYWDHTRKVQRAPDSTLVNVKVKYKNKPYRKAMLDIGIAATIIGGICSIVLGVGSIVELDEAFAKRKRARQNDAEQNASAV